MKKKEKPGGPFLKGKQRIEKTLVFEPRTSKKYNRQAQSSNTIRKKKICAYAGAEMLGRAGEQGEG